MDKVEGAGRTVLHIAANENLVDVVTKHIELGCDTNKTNNNGLTVLRYAAIQEHVDVVRVELRCDLNKASANVQPMVNVDRDQFSPMQWHDVSPRSRAPYVPYHLIFALPPIRLYPR